MLYMHDTWVNFIEDEPNPNLIHDFHSWKKDDVTELMDQIPLVIVNENLMDYIEYGLNEMPLDLLKKVDGKAYKRVNHERIPVSYGFIATDKKRVMAVQIGLDFKINRKSRLIPRQFQMVMEIVDGQNPQFELADIVDKGQYNRYTGLTRAEKEVLMKVREFVDGLSGNEEGMLKYMVSEWNYGMYTDVKSKSFDEVKNIVLHKLDRHELDNLHCVDKLIETLNKPKQIN